VIAEREPGRIFLSYRRTDAQHLAGRLYDRLEARFGAGNVFMDVDSIEPGLAYGEAIDKAVGSRDVLLVVIGTGWLEAVDEHNRRRLDDPDDLIVLEIATALQSRLRERWGSRCDGRQQPVVGRSADGATRRECAEVHVATRGCSPVTPPRTAFVVLVATEFNLYVRPRLVSPPSPRSGSPGSRRGRRRGP
jgi:hypothetical protein